ncbi:hypothetical protein [Streptomyces sp. NPDC052042]|uniref:hypothetical protein n=1 Tax=Streptomyces sp. NPDC052042 TaxID=3365683 RepID=UPI0037D29539
MKSGSGYIETVTARPLGSDGEAVITHFVPTGQENFCERRTMHVLLGDGGGQSGTWNGGTFSRDEHASPLGLADAEPPAAEAVEVLSKIKAA